MAIRLPGCAWWRWARGERCRSGRSTIPRRSAWLSIRPSRRCARSTTSLRRRTTPSTDSATSTRPQPNEGLRVCEAPSHQGGKGPRRPRAKAAKGEGGKAGKGQRRQSRQRANAAKGQAGIWPSLQRAFGFCEAPGAPTPGAGWLGTATYLLLISSTRATRTNCTRSGVKQEQPLASYGACDRGCSRTTHPCIATRPCVAPRPCITAHPPVQPTHRSRS